MLKQNSKHSLLKLMAIAWKMRASNILTDTTVSGSRDFRHSKQGIKKLLSWEDWYLHSPLKRSEHQEVSFDVNGGCQMQGTSEKQVSTALYGITLSFLTHTAVKQSELIPDWNEHRVSMFIPLFRLLLNSRRNRSSVWLLFIFNEDLESGGRKFYTNLPHSVLIHILFIIDMSHCLMDMLLQKCEYMQQY